jgi:hypothetical protein
MPSSFEEKRLAILKPLSYLFKGLQFGEFQIQEDIDMKLVYVKSDAIGVDIRLEFKRTHDNNP